MNRALTRAAAGRARNRGLVAIEVEHITAGGGALRQSQSCLFDPLSIPKRERGHGERAGEVVLRRIEKEGRSFQDTGDSLPGKLRVQPPFRAVKAKEVGGVNIKLVSNSAGPERKIIRDLICKPFILIACRIQVFRAQYLGTPQMEP